jgi:hypothetical protein
MAGSLSTHFREEGRGFRTRLGLDIRPVRTILVHLAVVAVFGVFLPFWLGIQFLSPVTIDAYACLGVLFAAPAAAQAFAGERPQSMKEALARVAMAALYGEVMGLAILFAGFMTMFFTPSRMFLVFDFVSLGEAIALGIAASLALSSIAGLVGLLSSPGVARMATRVMFLALLLLFFFRSQWLPDVIVTGTLVCLGLAIAAISALRYAIGNRKS